MSRAGKVKSSLSRGTRIALFVQVLMMFLPNKILLDVSLQTKFGHAFELHLKPYNSDPNSRIPEFLFLRFHLRTRFDFDAG